VSQPLWRPSAENVQQSNMFRFMKAVEKDWDVEISDYDSLYQFSIDEMEKFWRSLIDFSDLVAETWGDTVLVDANKMPGARWFCQARLSFAENLLRQRSDGEAIVFQGENGTKRRLSHNQLYDQVSQMAQAMEAAGVKEGTRIGAYIPNLPEAIIAMLAASSLGAVWSSCSPDFGVQGVLDRFGQITPKILIVADGYFYNGKPIDVRPKVAEVVAGLPSVEKVIVVPYLMETLAANDLKEIPNAVAWDDFIKDFAPRDIAFRQLPFDHPLYILYSSGTTGTPKCIIHSAGGTLLQHTKEHLLHCDIRPQDRVFYFTTLGWMMWNWMVSALIVRATLLIYDGSPFYPDGNVLFDLADAEDMTLFGISAKFIDAVKKADMEPAKTHKLSSLRLIASTGSPLVPESFDFVYKAIKKDVHLASVSGGTDIIGCFVAGDPTSPVWRGEIQARALGIAVEVFDDEGCALTKEKGELVCTRPFPSMPVGFWDDDDGSKYHDAYFATFPNVWRHGDYIEMTEHNGVIIHGRSDATLNPGGVRIGTAEIYRQVEKLDEVMETIAIGQKWGGDARVVLFVILRDGLTLDDALIAKIKGQVRAHCTPRHVPAKVVQVADIPRTKSGKITELAVRDVVHGKSVTNKEALANPEALELFKDRAELSD
jgi:acetoacetyl-CoA synthetase